MIAHHEDVTTAAAQRRTTLPYPQVEVDPDIHIPERREPGAIARLFTGAAPRSHAHG